jgi:hypothetical protein
VLIWETTLRTSWAFQLFGEADWQLPPVAVARCKGGEVPASLGGLRGGLGAQWTALPIKLCWCFPPGVGVPHPDNSELHDDAEREYAYGPAAGLPETKVGTFPPALLDDAKKQGWNVISMKKDWKRIFSFDQPAAR